MKSEIKVYSPGEFPQSFYLFDLSLKIVLPICSIIWEHLQHSTVINPVLIAKWFIFWGMGIYFCIMGIAQMLRPAFAAKLLFLSKTPGFSELIIQLGIINISIGVLAILSLLDVHALKLAASVAIAYFGLSTLLSFFRKRDIRFDTFRLITDLLLFSTSLLFLFFSLFAEGQP